MKKLILIVFLSSGPMTAVAQDDNVPPVIVSTTFQIYRYVGGEPFLLSSYEAPQAFDPNATDPEIFAREVDFFVVILEIFDPDFTDDEGNPGGDQVFVRQQSLWVPHPGYLAPEPPPMPEDSRYFSPEEGDGFAPGAGNTVFVQVITTIPQWIGKNQARLRGLIDWDVRFIKFYDVSNEQGAGTDDDAVFTFTALFLHCLENPALSPPNPPPAADAGRDMVVEAGSTVRLDGSATFDGFNVGFDVASRNIFEKDTLTFTWEWISGPERVDAITRDPLGEPAVAEVTLNQVGTYKYRLFADDGVNALPDGDGVLIEVVPSIAENRAPISIAQGPTEPVMLGGIITLDGTSSFDPDGDPLGFLWQQTDEIGGQIPISQFGRFFQPLSGLDTPVSRWQAIKPGTFHFRLLVNDGEFVNGSRVSIEVVENVTAGLIVVQPKVVPNPTTELANDPTAAAGQPEDQVATPLCGAGLFPVMMVSLGMFLMRGSRRK